MAKVSKTVLSKYSNVIIRMLSNFTCITVVMLNKSAVFAFSIRWEVI